MKLKKILSKCAAVALAAGMILPQTAFADSIEMHSYTAAGKGSVTCNATVEANFLVKLPIAVTLDNDQAFSMPVEVSGDLVKGDTVTVVPDKTVSMEYVTTDLDHKKDSVVGNVTAGKTEFTFEELFAGNAVKDTSTTVTVSGLTAGTWQGQLGFEINLAHKDTTDIPDSAEEDMSSKPAGLYNGKAFTTWEALENDGIVTVTGAEDNKEVDVSKAKKSSLSGKLVIPNKVRRIKSSAFQGCSDLTSITLPNSTTDMGSNAFKDCSSLKSINIPDGVTTIETYQFSGCSNLETIKIPETVTKIEESAFYNCSNLKTVTLPKNAELGTAAFWGCTSLKEVVIPKGTTSLSTTFCDCTSLTSVTIPNSVTSIESGVFQNCTSLKEITIPDSVTELGNNAFSNTGLTSMTLPNSITAIGPSAFSENAKLESIVMSKNLQYVSADAFTDCPLLTTIYYSGSVSGAPWGATNATVKPNNTL